MKPSRWLNSNRHFVGKRPGDALAAWLNALQPNQPFVKRILADAQFVHRHAEKYGSLHGLMSAHKQKKLPPGFWTSHRRLNETLATFTHAPQIDLHEFYDAKRVSWTIVTEQSPIALLSVQIRCILRLINDEAILKIRKCEQCAKWYFARISNQNFCSSACRGKHFSRTEAFKKKRRKYMRDYYRLKKFHSLK
jgi:hypothetical protein